MAEATLIKTTEAFDPLTPLLASILHTHPSGRGCVFENVRYSTVYNQENPGMTHSQYPAGVKLGHHRTR